MFQCFNFEGLLEKYSNTTSSVDRISGEMNKVEDVII